ncbi:MAG: hypothetical protein IJ060_00120 [Oscillospiraceae bacterium]|nr:hypothetical protein [Oscillospiraceae bacterium]
MKAKRNLALLAAALIMTGALTGCSKPKAPRRDSQTDSDSANDANNTPESQAEAGSVLSGTYLARLLEKIKTTQELTYREFDFENTNDLNDFTLEEEAIIYIKADGSGMRFHSEVFEDGITKMAIYDGTDLYYCRKDARVFGNMTGPEEAERVNEYINGGIRYAVDAFWGETWDWLWRIDGEVVPPDENRPTETGTMDYNG